MLIRLLFLIISLTAVIQAADHETFKNCSEIPLCSQRRELPSQERYSLDIDSLEVTAGRATLHLNPIEAEVEQLQLSITALVDGKFRVLIEEIDSTRYILEHVLVENPKEVEYDSYQVGSGTVKLYVDDRTVLVQKSPFSIEFFNANILQLVINGDKLFLENDEENVAFTFSVTYPQASRLYGLHEHAERLSLQSTKIGGTDPYHLRNLDVSYYELHSPMALYGMVPVLYGHGAAATTGVFLHNAAEQWIETQIEEGELPKAFYIVGGGALDLFILLGPTPLEVVRQYSSLTGVPHLPQIWALGYHQCRWGYWSQDEVAQVISDFDLNDFPIDVIWLDIQHTDNDKFFTWNPLNFSDPIGMLDNLASTNRRTVTISDPHFKKDLDYFVYTEALEKDLFVKYENGSNFEGECWPGTSSYLDYFNPATRDYYAGLYSYDTWAATPALGGIWNDMNEPSVFDNSLEKTFPMNLVHYGNVYHRDVHGIYGMMQTMASHQGLLQRDNNTLRPFILTRSHFAGSQRYTAIWTGDNTADWGWVPISWSMCLNANILGISFCGADVGGFWNDPSVELLERFYQAGAWLPFFRAHANNDTKNREPYLFEPEVQEVLREAIKTRYIHMPYWYTTFYEHVRNGDPVVRPLFYQYPEDIDVIDIDDHLLVGSNILARQVGEPEVTSVPVYFPGGPTQIWYPAYLENRKICTGEGWIDIPVTIDRIPVYYRAGSIIPLKPSRPSTGDMKNDPYTLIAAHDLDDRASGTLYLDDTSSFKYRDNLEYSYVNITLANNELTITSIDLSHDEDFIINIGSIVQLFPTKSTEGLLTGSSKKIVHEYTADGTLLSSIKFGGNTPKTVQLASK